MLYLQGVGLAYDWFPQGVGLAYDWYPQGVGLAYDWKGDTCRMIG